MNRAMITAAVSMGQLQYKLDTISNNIANSNTHGFKRRSVQFSDLLVQQLDNQKRLQMEEGRLTPYGIRMGTGVKVSDTVLQFDQGSIQTTERPLDLALLKPNNLFQLERMDEFGNQSIEYTRDGAFYLSPSEENPDEMLLVSSEGLPVIGTDGPIRVPADAEQVSITDAGIVQVKNGEQLLNVGQLEIVEVLRPQLLQSVGNNHYQVNNGIDLEAVIANVENPSGSIQQGALEQSNVDVGLEMTELLTSQRAYQLNARSVSMADQMMGLVNGIR